MKKKQLTKSIRLFLSGFSMGSADIVPGVSGGTIAFILGIYEELVYSIKVMSGDVLKQAVKGKFKDALQTAPLGFLIPLGLGLFTALFTLARLISFLLVHYPILIWSFFFGLIIGSVKVISKRVVTWDTRDYALLAASTLFAFFLVGAVPVETPNTTPFLFLAGAIAIVAMILPGISGSFILIILGKYEQILDAVVNRNMISLGIVAIGAVVGLALFSRVLSYLFSKHHDIMIATLTGFIIGSLRKVWPFKEIVTTRINSHGIEVPLKQINVLPKAFDFSLLFAVSLFAFAFILIFYLDRTQALREQTADVESREFEREHKKALRREEPSKIKKILSFFLK